MSKLQIRGGAELPDNQHVSSPINDIHSLLRGLSAHGAEQLHDGLRDADDDTRGHGLAGGEAILLLATIAQQLTRIADAAERFTIGADQAEPQREKTEDPLRLMLESDEDYENVKKLVSMATRAGDLSTVVRYLRRHGYHRSLAHSEAFVNAIIPHLVSYGGAKDIRNLRRALY